MEFDKIYDSFRDNIEQRLSNYVQIIDPEGLYEPFKYLISGGGKRIRPVLAMICSGAVGGDPKSAIDSGAAIEILHNFTLVHDDIMDESPLRRGRATVHVKWNEPIAILVGDVMVGYAYKLLPDGKSHERSDEINKTFTNSLIEVCEGQALDMEFNERKDVSLREYFDMIEKKTARLLESSSVIGAYCGLGSEKDVESLRLFARSMGLAFQIQDDFLDLTADQEKLGKSIGQDIIEGKKTYFILKAQEKVKNQEDIELISEFINQNGLTKEYVPRFINLFDKLGIFDEAQTEIEKHLDSALQNLNKLNQNDYTDMLKWLLEKLNKRNY